MSSFSSLAYIFWNKFSGANAIDLQQDCSVTWSPLKVLLPAVVDNAILYIAHVRYFYCFKRVCRKNKNLTKLSTSESKCLWLPKESCLMAGKDVSRKRCLVSRWDNGRPRKNKVLCLSLFEIHRLKLNCSSIIWRSHFF